MVTLVAFVWLFSLSFFKIYPQIACPRRGLITLVTFVWFFTTVNFQMCPQKICPWGRIFTSIAFVWLFSGVRFQTLPQIACLRGWKVTLVAYVWLFFTVCFQMCPQRTFLIKGVVALVTFVWYKPYYQSRCGLKKPGCQSEAEGRGLAAWFFKTTSRLVVRFNILSDITGRTPELKCRFENHWQPRLLRPGGPKV